MMILREKLTLLFFLSIAAALLDGCKNDDMTGGDSLPTITEMQPAQVSRGQEDVTARILGSNFTGLVTVVLGDGVDLTEMRVVNPTKIQVRFHVHTDAEPGKRTVTISTTAGTIRREVFSIVDNSAPIARFRMSPANVSRNVPVTFDASESSDPDGPIQSFDWDFGDGSKANGQVVTHRYGTHGTFQVKLTATDHAQVQGIATKEILIDDNQAPGARFSITPRTGSSSTLFAFDASESEDADGQIKSYQWSFGDGGQAQGQKVTHRYGKKGTFAVRLLVRDDNNAQDEKGKEVEVVGGQIPTADFSMNPESGTTATTFQFDGSLSHDPDGTITNWVWNFDDGTAIKTGRTVTHRFSADGEYEVHLTATDNDGLSDTTSETVEVGTSGGGGDGQQCQTPAKGRDYHFFEVLSHDASSKTLVGKFNEDVDCSDVFYLCGDVRIGGMHGQKEYWIGTICRMDSLGNNTFKIYLTNGNSWVSTGERETYVWPQLDCKPSESCRPYGY